MPDPLLILNPEAGGLRGDPRLLTRFKAHGALKGVEVIPTAGPEEIRSQARRAREDGRSHLLVAGGDGTIHQAVSGLLEGMDPESIPPSEELPVLGVLPAGTGNDLARSLGLPLDLWKALGAIDFGLTRPLDLIRVQGVGEDWCVNVATGGMVAQDDVAPEAEAKVELGVFSYVQQGLKALEGTLPLYHLEMTLDQESPRTLQARILVVGNGRFTGGAIPVAPSALLDDGLLDLLVVPELDRAEMSILLPRLMLGRHEGHQALFTARARRIEIRSEPALDLSLDGELTRTGKAVFSVMEGALSVLVGPDAGERAFRE